MEKSDMARGLYYYLGHQVRVQIDDGRIIKGEAESFSDSFDSDVGEETIGISMSPTTLLSLAPSDIVSIEIID